MAPMEEVSKKCPMCSQGGGVYVFGGTYTFTGCYIYNNKASNVRLGPSHSMAPMEDVSRK